MARVAPGSCVGLGGEGERLKWSGSLRACDHVKDHLELACFTGQPSLGLLEARAAEGIHSALQAVGTVKCQVSRFASPRD